MLTETIDAFDTVDHKILLKKSVAVPMAGLQATNDVV